MAGAAVAERAALLGAGNFAVGTSVTSRALGAAVLGTASAGFSGVACLANATFGFDGCAAGAFGWLATYAAEVATRPMITPAPSHFTTTSKVVPSAPLAEA